MLSSVRIIVVAKKVGSEWGRGIMRVRKWTQRTYLNFVIEENDLIWEGKNVMDLLGDILLTVGENPRVEWEIDGQKIGGLLLL